MGDFGRDYTNYITSFPRLASKGFPSIGIDAAFDRGPIRRSDVIAEFLDVTSAIECLAAVVPPSLTQTLAASLTTPLAKAVAATVAEALTKVVSSRDSQGD